jgi:septal ring factor EnvC (AmiA/AmiB activator)
VLAVIATSGAWNAATAAQSRAKPPHAVQSAKPGADANATRLKSLEREAEKSRARAADLAQRSSRMRKELDEQRESLTEAAADVRAGEVTLSRLEGEQSALAARRGEESQLLARDRAKLARLAAGLLRLSRIPPGGLLAWSEAPIDADRASMLLSWATEATRAGAREKEAELARLHETEIALDAKTREATHAAGILKARRGALADLVAKRQAVYQRTDSDRQAEEERAQAIATEAKDLRDLVARIEAERQAAEQREAEARRKAHAGSRPASAPGRFAEAAGLPISGRIKTQFGQNDGLGTTSRGITIIARPGATVTAPAAGKVRFAGQFRGYREILILEHSGGYLSLIAGMSRIDVAVGTSVGAGEPVGTMDERPEAKPELYFELRRNGQPVDPEAVVPPVDAKGKAR